MRSAYLLEVPTRVAGIPCIVGVTHLEVVDGSYSRFAPSDLDYYGYVEAEWDVLDRRGRPAPWLARKTTGADRDKVEQDIIRYWSSVHDH